VVINSEAYSATVFSVTLSESSILCAPRTSEKAGGAGSHESTWRSKRAETVTLFFQAKSSSLSGKESQTIHPIQQVLGSALII
jgi:hypothetical protein